MNDISMQPMTKEAIAVLFRNGCADVSWPVSERTFTAFQSYLEAWSAAETMGFGAIRALYMPSGGSIQVIGFVTFNRLDNVWSPSGASAVESGTFLLPSHRRQGLNAQVKALAVTYALTVQKAQFVLYAVPDTNEPALRSLRRILGEPSQTEDKAKSRAETLHRSKVKDGELFQKWLRYREWKEGKAFMLFVISSETAKACHLLNPDGDHSHFAGEQENTHDD